MNIAMWSGPRNLSTAMMRSFGARADCDVWDEPFYAAYLAQTGSPHPMASDIIDAYETDASVVAARCEQASAAPITYQKHMTHHMIDGFPRTWLKNVVNVFLIRAPERVVASYHAKRQEPELADLGFVQQAEIFRQVAEHTGEPPPVIDAFDIRRNPSAMLPLLCQAIGIAFEPAMLQWSRGARESDGIWGQHWYQSVWDSTAFAPPEEAVASPLEGRIADVAAAAEPYYREMSKYRLCIPTVLTED